MTPSAKLLKRAIIPDTVKLIGDGAFNGILIWHMLPVIWRIGDNVFSNCRNLDEIIIPESVKEIGCNVLWL